MNSTENTTPEVSFKETTRLSSQVVQLGGMAFLLFCVAVYGGLNHNQWGMFAFVLLVMALGAALQWLCQWVASRSTEYRLWPNSFWVDDIEFELDEIAAIHWPMKREGEDLLLGFSFHSDSHGDGDVEMDNESNDVLFSIPMNNLKRDDRLLLVQYFQQQAAEQRNWKEFCCRYLDRWLSDNSKSLFPQWLESDLLKHPFWSAFSYSPVIYLICLRVVSKYVYWSLGFAITVSAVINIRLMHGSWLSPIGETVLGSAAVLFVLGAISAWHPIEVSKKVRTRSEQRASFLAGVLLVAAIILGPLSVQLLTLNGNKWLAIFVLQAVPWLPVVPMFVQLFREQKERRENTDQYFHVAIGRWETHCANQRIY